MYPQTGEEWLKQWDDGSVVWSVSMGGLGPGYEQCIQMTAAEILRSMLAHKLDAAAWSDSEAWKRDRDAIDAEVMAVPAIKALGLSGAQWGAAINLASCLYMRGPRVALTDEAVKDRLIQVSRTFPSA